MAFAADTRSRRQALRVAREAAIRAAFFIVSLADPAFAAPGVAAKARADKASAEAIAIIEIAFMAGPKPGYPTCPDGEPNLRVRL